MFVISSFSLWSFPLSFSWFSDRGGVDIQKRKANKKYGAPKWESLQETAYLHIVLITQYTFGLNFIRASMHRFWKICYDKAGNLPNKGRNFNTQTWGKIVYFLFVWLVGIGFRQNFFRVLPNFGDFGAKMSFFHYIINQKRNNFIKHCSPRVPRSRWYQRCVSI